MRPYVMSDIKIVLCKNSSVQKDCNFQRHGVPYEHAISSGALCNLRSIVFFYSVITL